LGPEFPNGPVLASLASAHRSSRQKVAPKAAHPNAIGFAREIQREQDARNPVVVDSSNEIQAGTGARELARVIEKSLEPVTRYLYFGVFWSVSLMYTSTGRQSSICRLVRIESPF
jgi:hypothetical protein